MTDAELIAWLRSLDQTYWSVATRGYVCAAADRLEELTRSGYSDPPLMYREPQPGFVRVRVAVASGNGRECACAGPDEEAMAQVLDWVGSPTHRCIAIVDVPPVAAFPELPARVEEV